MDDGSTDATAETVARFREDPRVRYHWQPNAGQTAAKNHGIREARGEFIAFCDADDMWMPHKLATQIPRFATDARLGVVYSRTALMNEHGERIESDHSDDPRFVSGRVTSELFKLNFVPFGAAVPAPLRTGPGSLR